MRIKGSKNQKSMNRGPMGHMEGFNYVFTAVRGIQAGRCYFVAMCPLKLVPKIFLFNEEELNPELRAQRVLNRSRVPQITKYILDNRSEYVFASLTACIDGEVKFEAISSDNPNLGRLIIPMSARFLLNDGQHRRAAIEEAIKVRPELGEETISAVLFVDTGLQRSQQMFADLNMYSVRPTKSLGILYDYRDPLGKLVRKMAANHVTFKDMTELEKTSISNRSRKLFTLSSLYQATEKLLNYRRNTGISRDQEEFAHAFWTEIARCIPDWKAAKDQKISSAELRHDFIHAHGIALQALGIVGASLLEHYPDDWRIKLSRLSKINWRRSNSVVWEGRATAGGQVSKIHNYVLLTANYIKKVLGIPFSDEEKQLEDCIDKGRKGEDIEREPVAVSG